MIHSQACRTSLDCTFWGNHNLIGRRKTRALAPHYSFVIAQSHNIVSCHQLHFYR